MSNCILQVGPGDSEAHPRVEDSWGWQGAMEVCEESDRSAERSSQKTNPARGGRCAAQRAVTVA